MKGVEEARALAQLLIENLAYCIDGPPPAPLAPYLATTDRVMRPKPPLPTLGKAGYQFADPTYGSRILRVTDGVAHPGRSYDTPSNTHLAAWSADSLKFYVWGPDGPEVYAFDPAAFTATRIGVVASQPEPTFSRTEPDLLYTVGGPRSRTVQAYVFSTEAYTPLLDVDTLGVNLAEPRTYVGSVLEAAGIVVVSYGGQGQGGHYLVTARFPDGTVKTLNTVDRMGCHLHSLGFDLAGRMVAVYPNNADPAQVIFWDLVTDAITEEHVSMYGHDALGFGVQTNQDTSTGAWDARQWSIRSLADVTHPTNLIPEVPTPQEIYTADHQSWNNAQPDSQEPVIASTYRTPAAAGAAWLCWLDEVLAISTDGSGIVYRFAHHRHDMSDGGKWSQPICHVAPNGRAAIVTSNWAKSLGLDTNEGGHRNDVFLIELL